MTIKRMILPAIKKERNDEKKTKKRSKKGRKPLSKKPKSMTNGKKVSIETQAEIFPPHVTLKSELMTFAFSAAACFSCLL